MSGRKRLTAGPIRHQHSGTTVSKTGRPGPQTIPRDEIHWAIQQLTNEMNGTIHRRLWPLWGTPSTHLSWPVAGSVSPGGLLATLGGPPLPPPFLAARIARPGRHPTNEIAQNIHRRLWPLWGTPSTHPFWPVAGSVSPGGLLATLGGPLLPPPFLAARIARPGRHPTNEIAQNIHSRLWPLWGTPSTHRFWPGAGPNLRRGCIARLGGPPWVPPIFCGRRRPRPSASRPIRCAKTFTAVCGLFGAPPARPRLGRCPVLVHSLAHLSCTGWLSVCNTVRPSVLCH